MAFFGARQRTARTSTDQHFEPERPREKQLYDEDVTTKVYTRNPRAEELAFRQPGEILVCLGSSATQTILFRMRLDHLLEANKTYQVEVYSSE